MDACKHFTCLHYAFTTSLSYMLTCLLDSWLRPTCTCMHVLKHPIPAVHGKVSVIKAFIDLHERHCRANRADDLPSGSQDILCSSVTRMASSRRLGPCPRAPKASSSPSVRVDPHLAPSTTAPIDQSTGVELQCTDFSSITQSGTFVSLSLRNVKTFLAGAGIIYARMKIAYNPFNIIWWLISYGSDQFGINNVHEDGNTANVHTSHSVSASSKPVLC